MSDVSDQSDRSDRSDDLRDRLRVFGWFLVYYFSVGTLYAQQNWW